MPPAVPPQDRQTAFELMMPAPPAMPGRRLACHPSGHDFPDSENLLVGYTGFLLVGIGGALGCWLRWTLGVLFNPLFPTLPLGTLAANLVGGLLMGCVLGLFDHYQTLPPELRLFLATGFLGGLTTFSTFSAEATTLLLRQQYLWFGGHVAVHLFGSIAMTITGIALTRVLLKA